MKLLRHELKRHFITDGQLFVTTSPSTIHTILGSCVSVCLWDKNLKLAGMNHYLMPGAPISSDRNLNQGYVSIPALIKLMINRGAYKANLEAKIFGGCNSWVSDEVLFGIGMKNIEVAEYLLKEAGILVTARHTGGIHGRKIVFNTLTGKVGVQIFAKTVIEMNEQAHKGFNY